MKLVFVHGFLGSSMNWSPILNRLHAFPPSAGWSLMAPELLAHGRRGQDRLPRPLTLEAVAVDLERQLPDEPFIGIGHSFGLRPLLKLAPKIADRLTALVAEDSSPAISGPGFDQLMDIFDKVPVPFATREKAKDFLDGHFGVGTAMSKFLLSNIRERAEGVHDWRFHREALRELLVQSRDEPLWAEWAAYPRPVHMILGEKSQYVNSERQKMCLEKRPGLVTKITFVEGAGHWVHSDKPENFMQELVRVIKSFEG